MKRDEDKCKKSGAFDLAGSGVLIRSLKQRVRTCVAIPAGPASAPMDRRAVAMYQQVEAPVPLKKRRERERKREREREEYLCV